MHSPLCLIGRGHSVHALMWGVTFMLGRRAMCVLRYVCMFTPSLVGSCRNSYIYFYLVACDALASYCAVTYSVADIRECHTRDPGVTSRRGRYASHFSLHVRPFAFRLGGAITGHMYSST